MVAPVTATWHGTPKFAAGGHPKGFSPPAPRIINHGFPCRKLPQHCFHHRRRTKESAENLVSLVSEASTAEGPREPHHEHVSGQAPLPADSSMSSESVREAAFGLPGRYLGHSFSAGSLPASTVAFGSSVGSTVRRSAGASADPWGGAMFETLDSPCDSSASAIPGIVGVGIASGSYSSNYACGGAHRAVHVAKFDGTVDMGSSPSRTTAPDSAKRKDYVVEACYLPMDFEGTQIVVWECGNLWRVDGSQIQCQQPGLAYRSGKSFEARRTDVEGPMWGDIVEGVDEGDGWLRCSVAVPVPEATRAIGSISPVRALAQRRPCSATTARSAARNSWTCRRPALGLASPQRLDQAQDCPQRRHVSWTEPDPRSLPPPSTTATAGPAAVDLVAYGEVGTARSPPLLLSLLQLDLQESQLLLDRWLAERPELRLSISNATSVRGTCAVAGVEQDGGSGTKA